MQETQLELVQAGHNGQVLKLTVDAGVGVVTVQHGGASLSPDSRKVY